MILPEGMKRRLRRVQMLNLASEMGYQLMVSGAEIYRTEDSVIRLFKAYGIDCGEVFAIPNCLIISLTGEDGEPLTRIRRIPSHDTDLERLECYNSLSRTLCRETPEYDEAMRRLHEVLHTRSVYSFWVKLIGFFVGTASFCMLFGGRPLDALFSGICGVVVGLSLNAMSRMEANGFFKTIVASAVAALPALICGQIWELNQAVVIAGAYMPLFPGMAFTTAMRDIMAGDLLSGLEKVAECILIAIAIVLGAGAAMGLFFVVRGG